MVTTHTLEILHCTSIISLKDTSSSLSCGVSYWRGNCMEEPWPRQTSLYSWLYLGETVSDQVTTGLQSHIARFLGHNYLMS